MGRDSVLNEIYQNHWLDEERGGEFSFLENISGGNL